MQDIIVSDTSRPNPHFSRSRREDGESNVAWLSRQLADYRGVAIVLIGGTGNLDFRIRVAQSHLRHSFTPSHWSHCFLILSMADEAADTPVYEISLDPYRGFRFPGATNGMQEAPLGRYHDTRAWPNIGVIRMPSIDPAKAEKALIDFGRQRAVIDAVGLILRWLAFGWGAGNAGNPILEGNGLPSAAMVETICNTTGYDISPLTPSRSSTPEALWQATKWWYEVPRTVDGASRHRAENELPAELPTGAFYIGHELGDQSDMRWSETLK